VVISRQYLNLVPATLRVAMQLVEDAFILGADGARRAPRCPPAGQDPRPLVYGRRVRSSALGAQLFLMPRVYSKFILMI
jgi:hypothetical protein